MFLIHLQQIWKHGSSLKSMHQELSIHFLRSKKNWWNTWVSTTDSVTGKRPSRQSILQKTTLLLQSAQSRCSHPKPSIPPYALHHPASYPPLIPHGPIYLNLKPLKMQSWREFQCCKERDTFEAHPSHWRRY